MTQVDHRTPIDGFTWSERTTTAYDDFLIGQVSGAVQPLVEARVPQLWWRSSFQASEEGTSSIARLVEDTLSWVKLLGWHLASPLVIRRFLFENADSLAFIQLAASTLRAEIGHGKGCGIRVERHPDSHIEELVLIVRSSHYDREFLSWLDRVREPLAAFMGASETPMAITSDLQPIGEWSSTGVNI